MSSNAAVAEILNSIADLLDLAGERFKPEAYRRAARSIEALPEPLGTVEHRGELEQIPGIGEAIAEKIREFLRTGHIGYYDRLRQEFPAGLIELMQLPGIGPKTARRFWTELGVEGPAELSQAIETGRLDSMKGFGPKKIDLFRGALAQAQQRGTRARTPLLAADAIAREIVDALRAAGSVHDLEVAGSLRRRRENVGDLDILATSPEPETVLRTFTHLPAVSEVKLAGGTKATVLYGDGMQVDLRVVEPKSFGAALQYFTGSKDHNIHLRTIARDQGYKINEYGVFRGESWVAGRTEEEVYHTLGLDWMPPEIRENQGEIEAATRHEVPKLISVADLRGLLHVHLPPDLTPSAVDELMHAASGRWTYLAVVVSTPSGSSNFGELKDAAWDRLEHYRSPGRAIRVLFARECTPTDLASEKSPVRSTDFSILSMRDSPADVRATAPVAEPPWMLAHPPRFADAGSAVEALRRLNPWKAPIDVTPEPGADGFDSAVVRQWVAEGGQVVISPGGTSPMEDRRLEISAGLARRGWTGPERVRNARPLADILPPPRRGPKKSRRADG